MYTVKTQTVQCAKTFKNIQKPVIIPVERGSIPCKRGTKSPEIFLKKRVKIPKERDIKKSVDYSNREGTIFIKKEY